MCENNSIRGEIDFFLSFILRIFTGHLLDATLSVEQQAVNTDIQSLCPEVSNTVFFSYMQVH